MCAEPIIVVLGPWCGGTSAVAKVLHHLGVLMGTQFDWNYRELHDTWEDSDLSQLCRRAFSEPDAQLQMDAGSFETRLRSWADNHRRAARIAGRRPGVKHPLLCVSIDFIRDAWGPVVPVVVDRPVPNVLASLNRLGWWKDEQERAESTAHLIAARDLALAGTTTVRVDFEALRATPAVVIRRLADELGLVVTGAQVQAAADSVVKPTDVPRDVDPHKRFIDQLMAEVTRNPADARPVFLLAQVYFHAGDFANARKWFARRLEMDSLASTEEVYWAMLRVAHSMEMLGEPWPDVQDAYLRAWEFRPTRAEPLYALARRYANENRHRLGYLFAERAAEIPPPEDDMIVPHPDIYTWRAAEVKAICANYIGKQAEAFTLCRRLLARPDILDGDRQRMAGNRDVSVPTMLEAASAYPDSLARNLISGPHDSEVTVTLVAGADRAAAEQTLNSFLNCCTDVARVGRFLMIDAGLSAQDRAILQKRYEFVDFADCSAGHAHGAELEQLRDQIHGRYWLHLGQGWQFFAPENLITRLIAVLDAETQVFQVGINLADAVKLTGTSAPEQTVRRTPDAGRYVLAETVARGPSMFDTARLDRTGGMDSTDPDPIAELGRCAAAAGLQTASLDEVLCITAV
ncbi:tetratricopeptide repeat protein [Mycobacterium sp.]|uniref:tetratricopeptide repeat protein n=1 Tax=Mycobacterium sp. TaxID=1785 RepID=UPI003C75C3AD